METKQIIVGVTGGIAAYKACDIVSGFKKQGHAVTVVMTKEAEEFIRPLTLQALSGNKVYRSLFEEPTAWEIEHVSLAQKADCIVIAPATANIIGKIACGICDDLLTCVVCASRAPVVVCPAMNTQMYENPVVQENMKKLRSLGYAVVAARAGRLACGKVGVGCLADVETIIAEALNSLRGSPRRLSRRGRPGK